MAATDIRLFMASWLRSPLKIGALVPSSAALADCMAAQLDPENQGTVLELGPGTGTVTRALLARGLEPAQLVIVERDANFCHLLRNRFPGVQVLHADARSLKKYSEPQINCTTDCSGLQSPTAVSGFPNPKGNPAPVHRGAGPQRLICAVHLWLSLPDTPGIATSPAPAGGPGGAHHA